MAGGLGGVGDGADRAQRNTGKLAGAAKGAAKFGGVLGAAFLIDEATNNSISDLLNNIAGLPTAAERAKAGIGEDFWSQMFESPAAQPGDMDDIRNIGDTVGVLWSQIKRDFSGFDLDPIEVDILSDPSTAMSSIESLLGQINGSAASVNIDGNDVPAGNALRSILSQIAAGAESVVINGDPVPANQALEYVKNLINTGSGEVTINGETMPAGEALAGLLGNVGASVATMTIDGNADPATGKTQAALAFADGSTGTVTLDANGAPASAVLGNTKYNIDSTTGVLTIDGNPAPGEADRSGLKATIDRTTGIMTVAANPGPANQGIAGARNAANASRGTMSVDANTSSATSTIQRLRNWASNAVSFVVNAITGNAAGGVLTPMATGGVLGYTSTGGQVAAYAAGGFGELDGHRLRPMPKRAAAVAPNTWRVIGDNLTHTEVYAPLDGSASSLAYLRHGLDSYGMVAVDPDQLRAMASGGTLAEDGSRVSAGFYDDVSPQYRAMQGGAGVSRAEVKDWVWEDLKSKGWKGRPGDGTEALYPPTTRSTADTATRVETAVSSPAATMRVSSGTVAVADAEVRAEVRALRADIAASNRDAMQLAALRSIAGAIGTTRASATADAQDGAHRAALGAW